MKKRVLIPFILLNLLLVLALAGLFVLSEAYPLHPGDPLYKIQHVAEQWRLRLTAGEPAKALFALDLAERRLADLAQAPDPSASNAAAVAFDRALDDAVRRALPNHLQDLVALLDRAQIALDGRSPTADVVLASLQRKVLALLDSYVPDDQAVALLPQPVELSRAEPIPFLSQDIDHTLWPLTGGHSGLDCGDCHQLGLYAGTPAECQDCHDLPESDLYPDHFDGDCLDCHLVDSWDPSYFDHANIVDCQSCHHDDSPTDHYARSNDTWWLISILSNRQSTPNHQSLLDQRFYDRCADCHPSTDDWLDVDFDHFGFSDCVSCHPLQGDLASHYPGQCSTCHTTDNWQPLAFEHANIAECLDCHAKDSPNDHFVRADSFLWFTAWQPGSSPLFAVQQTPSSCANCHPNPETWTDAAFDHSGFDDCEACHPRQDDLENHYAGPCANCHTTDDWDDVSFDHTGYPDCLDCHSIDEPHYPDQCSLCHSIDDWQSIDFSHQGFAACSSCHDWQTPTPHFPGPCSLCHSTNDWAEIVYKHTPSDDCRACHSTDFDHYRGQCSLCHSTDSWSGAIQPHSGLVACGGCHPAPAAHYSGACANCHSAENWQTVVFDHTNYNDCRACHGAPTTHYPAQCSACHNTDAWANYYVNHSALASCSSCHQPPGNHWNGECSLCHDALDWSDITYSHYAGSDCTWCHQAPADHYPGQCSLCHNMTSWPDVSVNHAILTDCLSCHLPPDGHWPGQCSSCHGTSSWDEYTFNHDGYDNCKACHSQIRPVNHERGQCSQCHNTSSWSIPDTPTPTPEPPTPTPLPPTPTPTPTPEPPTPEPTEEAGSEPGTDSLAP
jgi:hypothetical protein